MVFSDCNPRNYIFEFSLDLLKLKHEHTLINDSSQQNLTYLEKQSKLEEDALILGCTET